MKIQSLGSMAIFVFIVGTSFAFSETEQKMDAYLKAWTELNMFSGTVLVAKDDVILLHKAYGKSDYKQDLENTLDSQYRIGSLTKGFTALAVFQLEQQGVLHRKDQLSQYCPNITRSDEITLEMLLNHRSGIHCHTKLPDFATRRRIRPCSLKETIKTFESLPLDFEPGSRFEYSNSNYILLGFIIEKTTGKSYAEVVQENIFTPLNMKQSGFEFYQQKPEKMAKGYILKEDRIVPSKDRVMQNAHASGALYSTAYDLYLWDRGLNPNSSKFDKDLLDKINTPSYKEYTYGWGSMSLHGKNALAHAGETEGFRPFMMRFVDENACIIVLSNFEHCPSDQISIGLAAILFNEPYRMPQKAVAISNSILSDFKDYVGQYEVKPGFVFTITLENKNLYCQPTGQPKLQLHPENKTTFFLREVEAKIQFIKDSNGRIELILHQNGQKIPAIKK